MLKEWLKAMMIFLKNGHHVIIRDVNNRKFSMWSIFGFYCLFIVLSLIVAFSLPQGISDNFIDYIKDIFAIFIGFFVTALTLIYDKLNVTKLPKKESIDRMSVNKRPSSVDIIRMKQEHNYVIRFFYSIGFNILFATITLLLLIPNIFWKDFFSLDISEYGFVHKIKDVDCESILLGGHIVFLFVYRLVVILLIANVFFYTVYMITSLLQVLILKKKI